MDSVALRLTLRLHEAIVAWKQPFADLRRLGLGLLDYLLHVLELTLEFLILDGLDIDAEAPLKALSALFIVLATLPVAMHDNMTHDDK